MSRNTKNISAKKPYCKVCHDAGKPESEYTSHWVKDLTGKTTCPTLLNTECRYCFKLGHTAKFCENLIKVNKERESVERRHKFVAEKPVAVQKNKPVPKGGFAGLCEDSDSEEEVSANIVVNEYPSLFQTAKKVEVSQPEVKTGWAAIAAKPKEVKPVSNSGFLVLSDYIKKDTAEKQVVEANVAPWVSKTTITKSWVDWSESEDELYDMNYSNEVVDDTW